MAEDGHPIQTAHDCPSCRTALRAREEDGEMEFRCPDCNDLYYGEVEDGNHVVHGPGPL